MHRKQHLLRNKVLFTAKSQLGSKNVTKHVYIFKDLFGYLDFFLPCQIGKEKDIDAHQLIKEGSQIVELSFTKSLNQFTVNPIVLKPKRAIPKNPKCAH